MKEDNKIYVRSVVSLMDENFIIPDYQRGYRWKEQQVKDLLNDISEFSLQDHKKKEFYCLQPVVVSKSDEQYVVVDGQQRLTTIRILLSALRNYTDLYCDKHYNISYETRPDSEKFIHSIDLDRREENIDYYHMCEAFETIKYWEKEVGKQVAGETIRTLLSEDEIASNVRVIWYEINEEDVDPRKVFTRLNKGKIPLNNAELVKALFLNRTNFDYASNEELRLRQLEIASEWDEIERNFRDSNNQVWEFLTNGDRKYDNRIELIFDLIANKPPKGDKDFTFRFFNEVLKNGDENLESTWKRVREYYRTFSHWHSDHQSYHLVGYLITVGAHLSNLVSKSEELTKREFSQYLKSEIRNKVGDEFETLTYSDDRYRVKNVLLLFNILTVLNYRDTSYKFQFGRYKREKWDIEHIHSTAADVPNDQGHKNEWLKEVVKFTSNSEIKDRCENYLSEKEVSKREDFDVLFAFVVGHYSEDGQLEEIDDISNLALLDSGTNRGYRNAVFPIKRNTIIQKDRTGTFIPPATRNTFMKYYSSDVEQMSFWGKDDRKSYLQYIVQTINEFLTD